MKGGWREIKIMHAENAMKAAISQSQCENVISGDHRGARAIGDHRWHKNYIPVGITLLFLLDLNDWHNSG